MGFKMKYQITSKYLTKPSKRRSGIKMQKVKFIVAHDTGNPKSTAINNVSYYERSRNDLSASAHIFVDDQEIIECIPALTGAPEKAWHVLYNKTMDNKLYGDDANDIAIGIEYCYGGKINASEAYKRFVWVTAYACYKFNLDPRRAITGHHILDSGRKSDPKSGLAASGRTYEQYLIDVIKEFNDCKSTNQSVKVSSPPIKVNSAISNSLKKGDRGDLVKKLQTDLVQLGFKLSIDGVYGDQTIVAVKQVQRWYRLLEDGICGSKTYSAIKDNLRKIKKQQNNPITNKEVILMITEWQKQAGLKALNELELMGLISNKEKWAKELGEPAKNWLVFELIKRIGQQVQEIKGGKQQC